MTRTFPYRPTALFAVSAFAASAAGSFLNPAEAAGIERMVPSVRPLFRPGTYLEFNLAHVRPELEGEDADLTALGTPVLFTGTTTDLFDDYAQFSFSLKGALTDRLSYFMVLDEPWGADTNYGQGSFPDAFSYAGTTADLRSYALTTAFAYDVTPNIKLYGGLRAQRTDAEAAIPFLNGYSIDTDVDYGLGWMVGAGYQIPAIALNVSLTYYSEIDHDFDILEDGQSNTSGFSTPRSVNLEFQSGVSSNTLVFGSVRWVDWSEFTIAPPLYVTSFGAPLVAYESDWWTYNIGIGRQLTENWSAAFQATYEPEEGGALTTLGPVDGRTIVAGSLTYKTGPLELTGGVSYGWIGETANQLETVFEDGHFTALGVRVGYSF